MRMSDFDVQLVDIAGAADDHRPTDAQLVGVPIISNWYFATYPRTDRVCLCGNAIGHPRLPDGPTTTRPLLAIDVAEGWVRTEGRYYRLGERDHN